MTSRDPRCDNRAEGGKVASSNMLSNAVAEARHDKRDFGLMSASFLGHLVPLITFSFGVQQT
jgi:hypothetical protein